MQFLQKVQRPKTDYHVLTRCIEDNDLLPIILMVQNLNMCAQETVKDVVMVSTLELKRV